MEKKIFVFFLSIFVVTFIGCVSTPVMLNTYKKGSVFYIENIDKQGNVIGLDNIVINNITFFTIKYEVLGINDLKSNSKIICEGTISGRDDEKIYMNNFFSNTRDPLSNYKYICIRFPEGTLKKSSAYCDDDDVIIDIEQFTIESNDSDIYSIDEDLFIELEKVFNQ